MTSAEDIVATAVRLAVAAGLVSWPAAILAVLVAALLLYAVKQIPPGIVFPTTDVPAPNVSPPLVVSPDGTIPLDQQPQEPVP